MILFEYRCVECRETRLSLFRGDRLHCPCPSCGDDGPLVRVFSVSVQRPMQEHWNPTVNAPVSSMSGFREQLKRKGEEYTAQTGIEVNYQPIDLSDRAALGVTDEGLDTTLRARHDSTTM